MRKKASARKKVVSKMYQIVDNRPEFEVYSGTRKDEFRRFLDTLKSLKVGQSFLCPRVSSNYRNAVSIAQYLLSRRFTIRAEGELSRVYRME